MNKLHAKQDEVELAIPGNKSGQITVEHPVGVRTNPGPHPFCRCERPPAERRLWDVDT